MPLDHLAYPILSILLGIAAGSAVWASTASDSPILSLEEVIGIEIQRTTLNERAISEGEQNKLVVTEADPSDFKLVRRFDEAYVEYRSIQIRAARGGWAGAMTVIPNGLKSPPAVFVLDPECESLTFPGDPGEMDRDDFEGRVYSRLPLGSQLIGAGYAVAFPTPKTLAKRKPPLDLPDWIALIKRFESKARIDPESLFLVATREYAELAIQLTANMEFAGVVIEAPDQLLFTQIAARIERLEQQKQQKSVKSERKQKPDSSPENGDNQPQSYFRSNTHAALYMAHAKALKAPVLIILTQEAPRYEQTRRTLLTSLVLAKADFRAALLERWARSPMREDAQIEDRKQRRSEYVDEYNENPELQLNPSQALLERRRFRYDEEQFEQWNNRMQQFLFEHANTEPRYLPPPERRAPSGFGRGGGFNGFEDPDDDAAETGDEDPLQQFDQ